LVRKVSLLNFASELHTREVEPEIPLRAYELDEERGREDGHEEEDWLRAQEEITQKKARTIAA